MILLIHYCVQQYLIYQIFHTFYLDRFKLSLVMDITFEIFHRVLSFAGIPIYAKRNWDSRLWLVFQIFNFMIGTFCFIFTTGFVGTNYADLLIFIEAACIWTTGVIMTISLGICLIFRNKFRTFLSEMAFKDEMLEMPLIRHVLEGAEGKKLIELKNMVIDSKKKLFKYTRVLFKSYVTSVWVVATLYLCSPIYEMFEAGDASLRLLGNISFIL